MGGRGAPAWLLRGPGTQSVLSNYLLANECSVSEHHRRRKYTRESDSGPALEDLQPRRVGKDVGATHTLAGKQAGGCRTEEEGPGEGTLGEGHLIWPGGRSESPQSWCLEAGLSPRH